MHICKVPSLMPSRRSRSPPSWAPPNTCTSSLPPDSFSATSLNLSAPSWYGYVTGAWCANLITVLDWAPAVRLKPTRATTVTSRASSRCMMYVLRVVKVRLSCLTVEGADTTAGNVPHDPALGEPALPGDRTRQPRDEVSIASPRRGDVRIDRQPTSERGATGGVVLGADGAAMRRDDRPAD